MTKKVYFYLFKIIVNLIRDFHPYKNLQIINITEKYMKPYNWVKFICINNIYLNL